MRQKMSNSGRSTEEKDRKVPPALLIAEEVRPVPMVGHYDEESQTWSNRNFDTAAQKKHNEQM